MPEGIELATSTPQAHIADATDAASAITQINAVLAALEQAGILATS